MRLRLAPALFLLFTFVTIAELFLIYQMAQLITWPGTFAVAILTGFLGSGMVKHAGVDALRRGQAEMAQGKFPAEPLAEGIVILVGGVLLITPGVLTDLAGLSTLIAPLRRLYARGIVRWAKRNVTFIGGGAFGQQPPQAGGATFDAEEGSYGSEQARPTSFPKDDAVDVEFRRR